MIRYILKQVFLGLVSLIGVSIVIFVATRLSGDVATLLAPQDATAEQLQTIRVQYGLDKPIPVQYYVWVTNMFHGDFGESIRYHRPALDVIFERFPATLLLGGVGLLFEFLFGVFFGVISATRRNSWIDKACTTFAMLGQAMPNFWVGIMLILVFSVYLHWLPTSGLNGIESLIMPAFALAWASMAASMRITRSSMMDVLDSEYVKFARIKGNPERVVILKHALKNSLIPVLSAFSLSAVPMIGGTAIIESIFRWPGVGNLIVEAISNRDYPLVQGGVLVISFFIIIINLVVDLMYGVVDPRIRH
jgi:peptide/nickel transport system permease protein